jgi:hypothetical protein
MPRLSPRCDRNQGYGADFHPYNRSSPNVELPCNKINGLQGIVVLVATNTLQQNQWVTDFEVKMCYNNNVLLVSKISGRSGSENEQGVASYL